ncbi:cytidylate kinase-like family protein [Thiohalomonas denitrificans]|uniref:Cytidylate kinase-like family protein n=1 Tax=Thiohalomonas denitrificans TaxID=415747 RepID=A0A1G5QNU2_9GAMM|nr:cytidylate kinase-like family protein [Thiohalomonas denitrificans]SCZ62971.1 Cytidylate kinase-like family protein [Thiohalomonas denitrificans]
MPTDVQELIQNLILSEHRYDQRKPGQGPEKSVVTISRSYGAGGEQIAERLSAALGVEVWDRAILDAVAESAKSSPELMAKLDDRVETGKATWIYNFLTGQKAFLASYRYHLVKVVLALSQRGGIIVGRGSHLILANRRVFRLRVVGSPERSARRISVRQEMDFNASLAEVVRVNKEREQFLWKAFGHHVNEPERFDLIVNTDHFDDRWDEITELVLNAIHLVMDKRKYR